MLTTVIDQSKADILVMKQHFGVIMYLSSNYLQHLTRAQVNRVSTTVTAWLLETAAILASVLLHTQAKTAVKVTLQQYIFVNKQANTIK
jgi:hypothetical protein